MVIVQTYFSNVHYYLITAILKTKNKLSALSKNVNRIRYLRKKCGRIAKKYCLFFPLFLINKLIINTNHHAHEYTYVSTVI